MLNWDDPLAAPVSPKVAEQTQKTIDESAEPVAANQTEIGLNSEVETPKPVNAEDKRVVNGQTDINQLAPFKYPWAWNYFINANKNHWTPLDINMAQDLHDYQHKLTTEERHVYETVLAYF